MTIVPMHLIVLSSLMIAAPKEVMVKGTHIERELRHFNHSTYIYGCVDSENSYLQE